jgi:hypothetical protein
MHLPQEPEITSQITYSRRNTSTKSKTSHILKQSGLSYKDRQPKCKCTYKGVAVTMSDQGGSAQVVQGQYGLESKTQVRGYSIARRCTPNWLSFRKSTNTKGDKNRSAMRSCGKCYQIEGADYIRV